MSSDKDVIGKADALLRKHAVAPPASGSDTGGVPLLTELFEPAPPVRMPAEELAREVFTRVMAEVEGRLAAEIERRVTQHLVPEVHAAVASAIGDLHQEFANVIGEAVAEALRARNVK